MTATRAITPRRTESQPKERHLTIIFESDEELREFLTEAIGNRTISKESAWDIQSHYYYRIEQGWGPGMDFVFGANGLILFG